MAVKYIHPNGSNTTGDGSYSNPWQTLKHAIMNSVAGDTIVLKKATGLTYLWESGIDIANRIVEGESMNPLDQIMDANNSSFEPGFTISTGNTTIKNITFQNLKQIGSTDSYSVGIFVITQSSRIVNITNCIIRNCQVMATGTATISGAVFASRNYLSNHSFVLDRVLVTRITHDSTSVANSRSIFDAGYVSTNSSFDVKNSSIHISNVSGRSEEIIHLYASTVSFVARNCIFMSDGDGISWKYIHNNNGTLTQDVQYTDMYNFTGIPSGTGNITSDPKFVDPASDNFELRPDSPCISAGTIL